MTQRRPRPPPAQCPRPDRRRAVVSVIDRRARLGQWLAGTVGGAAEAVEGPRGANGPSVGHGDDCRDPGVVGRPQGGRGRAYATWSPRARRANTPGRRTTSGAGAQAAARRRVRASATSGRRPARGARPGRSAARVPGARLRCRLSDVETRSPPRSPPRDGARAQQPRPRPCSRRSSTRRRPRWTALEHAVARRGQTSPGSSTTLGVGGREPGRSGWRSGGDATAELASMRATGCDGAEPH